MLAAPRALHDRDRHAQPAAGAARGRLHRASSTWTRPRAAAPATSSNSETRGRFSRTRATRTPRPTSEASSAEPWIVCGGDRHAPSSRLLAAHRVWTMRAEACRGRSLAGTGRHRPARADRRRRLRLLGGRRPAEGERQGAGTHAFPPAACCCVARARRSRPRCTKNGSASTRPAIRKHVIAYEPVGSGEGVRRFVGQHVDDEERVDFGASDAAMRDDEIAAVRGGAILVPVTAGQRRARLQPSRPRRRSPALASGLRRHLHRRDSQLERSTHCENQPGREAAEPDDRHRRSSGRQRHDVRVHQAPGCDQRRLAHALRRRDARQLAGQLDARERQRGRGRANQGLAWVGRLRRLRICAPGGASSGAVWRITWEVLSRLRSRARQRRLPASSFRRTCASTCPIPPAAMRTRS